MKLFDASPDLIKAVKEVMEGKKMSKDDIAALAGDKKKFEADDLAALRAGKHKHKKKHHVKEEEILDERNKENKFKKDLYVAKKGKEALDKTGHTKFVNDLENAFDSSHEKKHENKKQLVKDYKKTGRAMTKEEAEVAEGSTYGVSTPLKTKGTYTSENGRHVAKVRRDRDWGEWRVELHTDGKHQKKADYHTDDKEEAHENAKAMVAHAQKHEKPLKESVNSAPKPTSYDDGKSGFTPKGDKKGIVKKIINKYSK